MSRLYDTRECADADRLAYWTETVCSQILPVRIDPRHDAHLAATAMRSTSVGDLQVREVVGGEHLYERTTGDVHRGDPHTLQVGLQVAGSSLLVQDGREAVLGAGDIVLYDSSRPFTLAMDARFHWQVFLLPKDKLRRSDREISALTAVTIGGSAGVAGVVTRFLRDLAAQAPQLEADGASAALCDNAADLVATLVRAELGQQWHVSDPVRMLAQRAESYLEANLREPDLGPERVAHAVNVSVRRLHQVFETTGSTVGERIRTARLDAVRRDLADPRLAGLSVARIAAGHGLPNPSHFSRQFRQFTGCTPTEYRTRALRDLHDGQHSA
jgi:AraC-like DNA-binding protein